MTEMQNAALSFYMVAGVLGIYWEALAPRSILRFLCSDLKFGYLMRDWQLMLGTGTALLILLMGWPWLVMLHMIVNKR